MNNPKKPNRKPLSVNEYLQLVALVHLATEQNKVQNQYADAIAKLLGFKDNEADGSGWCWELIFGSSTVKKVLDVLKVKAPTAPTLVTKKRTRS